MHKGLGTWPYSLYLSPQMRPITNFDHIIASISYRIKLTRQETDLFISVLEEKLIEKKEYVLNTGDICHYDYFVNKGCLKVGYYDEKGLECIIKFAIEGWWVVDLDSFLHRKPAFHFIQALEDTELFRISKSNYDLLHEKISAFHRFSSERWQNGFLALQQRVVENISLTAEERYFRFVKKYPGLDQRIPQKLIASYLGITPEFLSALRKKWASVNS